MRILGRITEISCPVSPMWWWSPCFFGSLTLEHTHNVAVTQLLCKYIKKAVFVPVSTGREKAKWYGQPEVWGRSPGSPRSGVLLLLF